MADQLQGPDGGNLESGTGAIDTNEAGSIFASLISPEPRDKDTPAGHEPPKQEEPKPLSEQEALEKAAADELNGTEEKPDTEEKSEEEKIFTVKVDGKEVRLSADELINGYKAQKVSTQKFEQAAELRKTADAELARANAEIAAARQDRQTYAQSLQLLGQQLQQVMAQEAQVDLDRLAVENPAEYVKQKHLSDQRQAALQRVQQEQIRVAQQTQAEQARAAQLWQAQQVQSVQAKIEQQREELLAKLPDWKDAEKAKAENEKIVSYLMETHGYKPEEVLPSRDANGNPVYPITDHRVVLMARESMLYRQLMAKAKASTAKVEKLPPRAERPGTATAPSDGRTAAMQRLEKSGRPEDAASIFAQMFK